MKSAYPLAILLCLGAFTVGNAKAVSKADHPISKVIKLLEGLKAKSIAEGQGEAASYEKFTYHCSTLSKELKEAIADEKEAISELKDLIAGKTKEKEVLENHIDELKEQIALMMATDVNATAIRAKEEGLYKSVLADAKGTIQAVQDALTALQSAETSTESMLLAQTHVRKVLSLISITSSDAQVSALQAFAEQRGAAPAPAPVRPKQLAEGDLDAHVDKYDFKSENVIELLKDLKSKFEDDKLQATKEETAALNAYDLAKLARANSAKAAIKSRTEKETNHGKVVVAISDATAEKNGQQSDLKADSKGLSDTEISCDTKRQEWNTRSEVRKNEIAAMDVAMEILSKATGIRTAPPGNPVPPPSPTAFLQIIDSGSNPKMAAVQVLREAAQASHSRALERLAVEVSAHLSGPFDQVNNLVEKMIFRLMDEQKQEDEHKHWCDQELEKTNVMLDDKADKIKDLKAEIKKETATVGKLTEEIKDADKMIADIIAFKAEAREIRLVGHQENNLAIKDAETGQTALAAAIAVLTDFYKDSGEIKKEPWEFIQTPVTLPKDPATWDSPYTGVSDPDKQPGGIISVLETVMKDFALVESDTKAQEASDKKDYDQSMSDNDIEMSRRRQESDMKSSEKKRRIDTIATQSSKKKDTEGEHEKTDQYLTDLQPACVDTGKGASYENRKAARSKEITALKKAQGILENAFKQQKSFLQIRQHS